MPASTQQRTPLHGPWLLPVPLVRGLTGMIFGWAAFLVFFLKGVPGLDFVAYRMARPFSPLFITAGVLVGFAIMRAIRATGRRGPDIDRRILVGASSGAAALVSVCTLLGYELVSWQANLITAVAASVLCLVFGCALAYVLRRSALLLDSVTNWHYPHPSNRFIASFVFFCASLVAGVFVCMTPEAACVVSCACVPAALHLLPQGRLSLTPQPQPTARRHGPGPGATADATSPQDSSQELSRAWTVAPLAAITVLGISCGLCASILLWQHGSTRLWLVCFAAAAACAISRRVLYDLSFSAGQRFLLFQLILTGAALAITLAASAISAGSAAQAVGCTLCLGFAAAALSHFFSLLATGKTMRGSTPDARALFFAMTLLVTGIFCGILSGVTARLSLPFSTLDISVNLLLLPALAGCAVLLQSKPYLADITGPASDSSLDALADAGNDAAADLASSDGSGDGDAVSLTPEELRVQRCAGVAMQYGLSERQHDLLLLLYDGMNAQEVADTLIISRNTAKTHMAHIYAKLDIHTRAELDQILQVYPEDAEDAPADVPDGGLASGADAGTGAESAEGAA